MSIKVYITIDTEEDQWGEYVTSATTVHNVTKIPMLQDLFDLYKAIPTYLINYPVVMSESARSIIKEIYHDGRCGIGMHCHPWNTPPFREELTNFNSMLCNLPYDLVDEKLTTLHQAIVDRWGVVPLCFRAGRWGFSERVAQCIQRLGYKIDTSISPFSDWSEYGGPDFSDAPVNRYRFDPGNILCEDSEGSLLEVPPTVGFFQKDFKRCARIRKKIISSWISRYHLIGMLDRLRILNLRWLSPEACSGSEMVSLSKSFIRAGYGFLNMSFHSTSLIPGATPLRRSVKDVGMFLREIEVFLQFAASHGLQFVPLECAVTTL